MDLYEKINARKAPIAAVYRDAKHLSLSEFLENLAKIIGSLTATQIKVYSRVYERERN